MSIMDCIEQYIKNAKLRDPIFTTDIFEYINENIPGVRKGVINAYITRYAASHPDFIRYQKGIYYKTVTTPFGVATINYTELIKRTYIGNGNEIYGYETGPSLMNKLGLTTQMPNQTYIATERARAVVVDGGDNLQLLTPVTDITKENYRYLQFLDILDNKMKIKFEAENMQDILRAYIENHGLNFEYMLYYATFYKNKRIYSRIAELARGGM